jgi:hypothetical protein
MEGTTGGKTRPRVVTVEEIEDEDRPRSPLRSQSVTSATESGRNRLTTPEQNGDIQCHIADGRPFGEPDRSQLGVPVLQPLPFPMPGHFPRVEENTPSTSLPSVYLQRRCPICFSGSKPKLSNSACVSGLAN